VKLREGIFGLVALVACGGPPAAQKPVVPRSTTTLVVLPAESAQFPDAASAATEFLRRARVKGLDEPAMSKVSLEVVQLSIECVEATITCYEAVGKSLAANALLFATIDPGPKPTQVRVTVSLFDVDHTGWKRRATKLFRSEHDAKFGIRDVVEEATKP
jgi:hypothetical protein